jgi:hypothetical protein
VGGWQVRLRGYGCCREQWFLRLHSKRPKESGARDGGHVGTPTLQGMATLCEDGRSVSISVHMDGAKPDVRTLGYTYNLVYLLLANVFYEFLDETWQASAISTDSSGQMVLNSRRPENVITQHFGTLPASQYSVGPVQADRFVVLPVLDGSHAGISIGRACREGVLTEVHLRRIPKGWRFPSRTLMLTVSRKASVVEKPISDIIDTAIDRKYADSFNRIEIRLNRHVKGRKVDASE